MLAQALAKSNDIKASLIPALRHLTAYPVCMNANYEYTPLERGHLVKLLAQSAVTKL